MTLSKFNLIILFVFLYISKGHTQWEPTNFPIPADNIIGNSDTLVAIKKGIYGVINVSVDKGKTWNKINNGIDGKGINDAIKIGRTLFVSTNSGLFSITDYTKSWNLLNTGFSGQFAKITYFESTLFVVAKVNNNATSPIFKTTDLGKTWESFGPKVGSKGNIFGFNKNIMIYGTEFETYVSRDGGLKWNTNPNMNRVSSISIQNDEILIGQPNLNAYFSSNGGISFSKLPHIFYNTFFSGNHWVGVSFQNVQYSSDNGKTWREITAGLPKGSYFDSYEVSSIGDNLLLGNYIIPLKELDINFLTGPTNVQTTVYRDLVHLTWSDNSVNESGFVIERSDDDGKNFKEISRVGNNIKSYQDTTIRQRNFYTYRIAAIRNTTKSKYSNAAIAKITATTCVDIPSMISHYAKSVVFKAAKQAILISQNTYLTSIDGGKTITSKPEIINKFYPNGPTDIEFPSENVGYMLTSNYLGSYLKTNDGGNTWSLNATPKTSATNSWGPLDISFVSNDTGFVIYDYHYFKTINGGIDWSFHIKPEINRNSIQFLNSKIGFFVGREGIYKTKNGGLEWELIKQESYSSTILHHFISENIGFRIKQNILERTKDGGKTFEKLSITGLYEAVIHFQNEQIGFILTNNNIYRTTDSGLNWLKVTPNESILIGLTGVSSKGKDVIVVGGAFILTSHDLGETWEFKNKPNSGAEKISAIDENLMLFYSDAYFNDYGITHDGGKNIEKYRFPIDYRTTLMILINEQEIVAFAKKDNEYYSSDKPVYLFRSRDSGKTWSVPQALSSKIGVPSYLVYRNDKVLLVDAGPYIKSTDNGLTWQVDEKLSAEKGLFSYFLNEKNYFFSKNTTLFRSIDGGTKIDSIATFDTKEQVYSKFISSIYFINDQIGFVVGQGYFAKTIDGGKNWKYQNNPFDNQPYYVKRMYFLNENKGYIVDNNGEIYQTNNSGETWHKTNTITSFQTLNSIQKIGNNLYFLSNLNGESGLLRKLITVSSPPSQFIIGPTYFCLNDKITNYQTQDTQNSYKWQIPNLNESTIFRNNADIKWQQTGNYKIGLKIENDCGSSDLFEQIIQVKPKFEIPKVTVENDIYFTSSSDTDNTWLINGIPIPDAKQKTYIAEKAGTYQVQVTNQCGTGISNRVQITITANDENSKQTFEIFPNPSKDYVKLSFFKKLNYDNIFLLNNLGQRIELQDVIINETEATIGLKTLQPSVYILKVTDGLKTYTRKLVIMKQ